jgi:hypothetical protein
LVLECAEHRLAMYVTNFETDTIWMIASHDVSFLPARAEVRMTIRAEDGPSLGLTGTIAWIARDRIAVAIGDPFERTIVEAWRAGKEADLSKVDSRDLLVFDPRSFGDDFATARPPDSNWYAITVED